MRTLTLCVDKRDAAKKRRDKVEQYVENPKIIADKRRKSWILLNNLPFQKFYAPKMQSLLFMDGIKSLSIIPPELSAESGSSGDFCFPPLLHLFRLRSGSLVVLVSAPMIK